MKIIAATTNEGKVREFQEVLGEIGCQVISMHSAGLDLEIEETGSTYEENALIKARAVAMMCDEAVLADDSGLCVDALDGAPGLYSARFAGGGADDKERNLKILEAMEGEENRSAHYVAVLALILPDGREIITEGRIDGEILTEETGTGGFGYDPLFFCNEIGKCFGIATPEEKNAVSHRGKALSKLSKILKEQELCEGKEI